LLYNSFLEVSPPRSSLLDTQSETIERTEILRNHEDMVNTTVEDFSKLKKCIDICTYGKGVYLTINTKPIWEGYVKVKQRGARLRWITDITKENLSDCKKLMRIAEVRHLDEITGAFGIHDGIKYRASANVKELGQLPEELILSNVKVLVQQQQQVFNILWDKAIPSKQRIKEIEQGLKREFIDIIRDPIDIRKLIFNLVKSASEEISILFSSANAFHLLEREGILEIIREASSEHNVNIRILVDVRRQDELREIEEKVKWTRQSRFVTFQSILKSSFQTKITTLIVDSTYSLTVEMKDKVESFDESVGLATYSNSESNIDTYTSIFETLWMQNEYRPNTSQLNTSEV
jgi:two-component system, OmpR family, sensor histidine kinase VicK